MELMIHGSEVACVVCSCGRQRLLMETDNYTYTHAHTPIRSSSFNNRNTLIYTGTIVVKQVTRHRKLNLAIYSYKCFNQFNALYQSDSFHLSQTIYLLLTE